MPRVAEFLLVFCVVIVLLIPMAVTAGIIWLSLGRPLIFSQIRVGHGGRNFRIIKFRSMTDARDSAGQLLSDITRENALTAILRRTRMDELPQLFAILAGHLALVGPRPLLPETIAEFGVLGLNRCRVRPGMTGWAQVSGNTVLLNEEKLYLDLWYATHRSLALDLQIIAETFGVLALGERRNAGRVAAAREWLRDSGLTYVPASKAEA